MPQEHENRRQKRSKYRREQLTWGACAMAFDLLPKQFLRFPPCAGGSSLKDIFRPGDRPRAQRRGNYRRELEMKPIEEPSVGLNGRRPKRPLEQENPRSFPVPRLGLGDPRTG